MLTLILITFVSGIVTILAPCIWPLLPLLLSASAGEGRKRPAGIVLGIITSFTLFTLFLAYIIQLFPIRPDIFRSVAAVIIILLGITLLVPYLGRKLEVIVSRFSGKFGGTASKRREGFTGGYGTGFFLGVLWSPCAGPILAAVATLAATRSVTFEAFIVTLAFGAGIGVPLFVIATAGQKIINKSRALSQHTERIRQALGVVMILTALAIFTNFDKTLQTRILDAFPGYGSFLTFIEDNESVREKLNLLKGDNNDSDLDLKSVSSLENFGPAPEFRGIESWINTEKPLSLSGDLKGKVVLVDFWTYSCINCIRTLPFVTGWYEKYKDDGFVVIGMHTPEFAFERNRSNVIDAAKRYNINYPVAQDNDYETWRAYENRFWPAHYLIDANGDIRYVHFGEGAYATTEKNIQALLAEAGMMSGKEALIKQEAESAQRGQTPETYLGSSRRQRFASPEKNVSGGFQVFTMPQDLSLDSFSLGGQWKVEKERTVSGEGAVLEFSFDASKVFLVMSPPEGQAGQVKVFLDGNQINEGVDIENGVINVDKDRLYELVNLEEKGRHLLRLEFDTINTSAYAFTFG